MKFKFNTYLSKKNAKKNKKKKKKKNLHFK